MIQEPDDKNFADFCSKKQESKQIHRQNNVKQEV